MEALVTDTRARARQYYQEHKEEIQRIRLDTKKEMNEYSLQYYYAHKAELAEKKRKYQKDHPEIYRRNNKKYRERKKASLEMGSA